MERRAILRVLAVGAVGSQAAGQHAHVAGVPVDYARYQPRFFTAEEYAALDRLCEIILPGAQQAQVRFFIDTIVHHSDAQSQQRWRAGLKAVEDAAQSSFGKAFGECGARQQEAIVARMAEQEGSPETELQRFFGALKRMTVEGYCLSDIGAREGLGYRGDVSLAEFPGCTHPEHGA